MSRHVARKVQHEFLWYSQQEWAEGTCIFHCTKICLLSSIVGASCADGDLSLNSTCYRKFDGQLTWYNASNDCLSHNGSLAVFADTGRPSNNIQLTGWLTTNKTYWTGLVRSWWTTTSEGKTWVAYFYQTLVSCYVECVFALQLYGIDMASISAISPKTTNENSENEHITLMKVGITTNISPKPVKLRTSGKG